MTAFCGVPPCLGQCGQPLIGRPPCGSGTRPVAESSSQALPSRAIPIDFAEAIVWRSRLRRAGFRSSWASVEMKVFFRSSACWNAAMWLFVSQLEIAGPCGSPDLGEAEELASLSRRAVSVHSSKSGLRPCELASGRAVSNLNRNQSLVFSRRKPRQVSES